MNTVKTNSAKHTWINVVFSLVLGFILFPISATFAQTSQTFSYTGSAQTWVVPPCVTSITVTVAGAEGGGTNGGNGTVVTGTLTVTPGQTLQINVGGSGNCPGAGWNGGGAGQNASGGGNQSCGGGGASDIRVSPYNLSSRLVVAAGGGGMGGGNTDALAGNGGCANGANGDSPFGQGGYGASQTAGGAGGPPWISSGNSGSNGSLGTGGAGATDPCYNLGPGGGGGGGYYGGGGGGSDCFGSGSLGGGGGGGGSSYVPAGGGCNAGTNSGAGYVTITYTAGSASATASNTGPYCSGQTIQLNCVGSGSYSWTGPNGFTSSQQNPSIPNANAAMAGTYTVVISNAGCDATATTDVIINPVPDVNPIGNQTLCANTSTTNVNFSGSVAGTTFNWTNDNTSIGLSASGTGNIASFTATNSGAVTEVATITVTPTANGCTGSPETFTISVDPIPTVNPIADQIICAGDMTTAVAFTGSSAGTTYNWSNDNTSIGLASTGSGDIASFAGSNSTGSTQVATITVTPVENGCAGIPESFSITVNPIPVVNGVADQTVCANTPTNAVNFTGNVATAVYDWSNSNTSIGLAASGTGNIPSFTATNAGSSSITGNITVTPSANGCTGLPEVFSITVDPVPSVNSITDQEVCANTSVAAVNFSGSVSSATYSWTNDNTGTGLSASGTGNIASFTATNSGSSPITSNITVTPIANGCQGLPETFSITVNPLPVVTLSGNASVCEGDPSPTVTFTGSNGTAPYTFTYNINGGPNQTLVSTGSSGTINIPTTPPGTTVIMCPIIQDSSPTACSQPQSATVTVTVNSNPTPVITGPTDYCAGTTATLGTTQAYSSYSWSNGATTATVDVTQADNTITVMVTTAAGCTGTSSGFDVNETSGFTTNSSTTICQGDSVLIHGNYESTAGVYSQMFTASNGCDSTSNVTLNINPLPTVDAGSDKAACEGTPVTLTGSGANSYTWDNGVTDGVAFTQSPGTIMYTVTGTDVNGCVNTDQVSVTINQLPPVNAGADLSQCDGTTVILSGSGAQSYTWNNGVTDGTPFNSPIGATTYTVTGTDANGCVNTDDVIVTIHPIPVVNAGADVSSCDGDPVTLTATGASTYNWTSGVSNGTAFYPPLGTTTYTVTGTSAYGCENTDDVNVTVNPLPVVTFTADVTEGCAPLTVELTNTSPQAENCNWTIENNGSLNGCGSVEAVLNQPGCFDVTLELTSSQGCVNSFTETDYLCVEEVPEADFDFTPHDITSLNTNVNFFNNSENATDYTWNFGDNTPSSSDVNPAHTFPPNVAAGYLVTLIATTPYGCADTTYQYVVIDEALIYFIPNTFTPDGDFVNQDFQPIFTSGIDPYDYTMLIYNRWGELIFESHNPDVGWDGSYGGASEISLCQDGVYTWKIEFKIRNNDERMIILGNVNLIR